MNFVDFAIIAIIALLVGLAGWLVYRAKKNGKKCIGCPGGCSGGCGNCSCGK